MSEPVAMGDLVPFHRFLAIRLKTFTKKDLVARILESPGCTDTPLMVQSRSKSVLSQWVLELNGGSAHGATSDDCGDPPATQSDV